jgi:hypothetical protein
MVRVATVHLVGLSPFSPSKAYDPDVDPRGEKETADDHEKRVWRNRIHKAQDGTCLIPAMMIQFLIQFMAKRISAKIPGKRNATYTKHFEGGVAVSEDARIEGTQWEKVRGQWFHLNADGKRGGGTRVWRCMPMIDRWEVTFDVHLLDDEIPQDLFERVMREGGAFCGFGRFSPRRGGTNGRYRVESIEWAELGAVK